MIRYVELFAGVGGFRLGLDPKFFECVVSSEINEYARETYINNFNEMPLGDICEIAKNKELMDSWGNIDMVVGGFPCQPFSISGLKKGFEDENRGNMFFELLKIVKATNPSVVFLENVDNLIYHDKGNTFKVICSLLEDEGYIVQCKVLNANNFSLPQNRKRIYIVGIKGLKEEFSFPKEEDLKVYLKDILIEGTYDYLGQSEYTLLTSTKPSPNGLIFSGYLNKNMRKNGVRENTSHLSRSHRQVNRIYDVEGFHPTISASEVSGRYYILDKEGVRKMNIRELYRIQGFPDSFILHDKPTESYRQIGNAVPVNVIKAISSEILKLYYMYYK